MRGNSTRIAIHQNVNRSSMSSGALLPEKRQRGGIPANHCLNIFPCGVLHEFARLWHANANPSAERPENRGISRFAIPLSGVTTDEKRGHPFPLSPFTCCALLTPGNSWALAENEASALSSNAALALAAQMVPAKRTLGKGLDARKMQTGQQFRVTLNSTIHLKNGTELPRGTTLVGIVTADDLNAHGTARLALRFTQAELKNGKTIPIQAAIMRISSPEDSNIQRQRGGGTFIAPWDGKTLQVDAADVVPGVNLQSSIASPDSAVFVSTKKDNVKLSPGSQISLAIAAQNASVGS